MADGISNIGTQHVENNQRVVLLLEYNGSPYSGSQFQSQGDRVLPTIQSEIEKALRRLNLQTSAVHLSGRTDAGVNARGQVAHFDLRSDEGLKNIPFLASSLNAVLPDSISVKAAVSGVSREFNSQRDATHRWYRYTVYNYKTRSAMAPADSAWESKPLDVELMNRAAGMILGTHNFKAFRCSDSETPGDICTVYHSAVRREGNLVIFDIVANRFLYKMVRNLMGLLLMIGKRQTSLTPESIVEILESLDRNFVSWPTAKPEGLSLMAVQYPKGLNVFETDEHVQTLKQLLKMESMQDENLFRKAS